MCTQLYAPEHAESPEEAEFKKMRPPQGALSAAEAAEYVHGIPSQIKKHGIPAKRWANLEFKYIIEGKAPGLSTPVAEETKVSDSQDASE